MEKVSTSEAKVEISFRKYYPEGLMEAISLEEIPEKTFLYFEKTINQFVDFKDYIPGNFPRLFRISHPDRSYTYVATQSPTDAENCDTEVLAYLVDVTGDNAMQGFGELWYHPQHQSGFFKDKPFVGYTETLEEYRKKGLGTRRLKIMNALSLFLYGLPLYSDVILGQEAEAVWRGLVGKGDAKIINEAGKSRYVFLRK